MRLSEGVEWALHCCTVLAALPPGVTMPGAKLAEFHGVPAAYLAKHLGALSAAGIVESSVGRLGGYRLSKPARDVTLWDVVAAVEGEEPAFRCSEIRQRGPAALGPRSYRVPCSIAKAMWRAEDAWRRELGRTTLADLVADVAATVPAASAERALTWLSGAVNVPRS